MLTKKTRFSPDRKAAFTRRAQPRKEPSQERSRDTVAVILEAAARILETHGLEGYNTNAVAERAGVSIGSLYQYFPNKDAITVALIGQFELELMQAAQVCVEQAVGMSLEEALQLLVRSFYGVHVRRAGLHRLLEAEEPRLEHALPRKGATPAVFARKLLLPHRERIAVPLPHAVHDCITLTQSMSDAMLRADIPAAQAQRRMHRALCAYLLWRP